MESTRRWTAVVSMVGVRLAMLAAGLATSIITARALGPAGRGQYYAVVMIAGLAAQMANLGLGSSNTYFGAADPGRIDRLTVNSAWVTLLFAAVLAIGVAVASGPLSALLDIDRAFLGTIAALGPALLFVTLGTSLLVAQDRFQAVNGWQLFNSLGAMLLLIGCARAGLAPGLYLAATTAVALATAAGIGYALRPARHLVLTPDVPLLRQGFGFAFRAYLATLAAFAIQRTGATVLASHGDMQAVGLFSIAAQVFDVLVILPSTVGLVLFPSLVRQQAGGWSATVAAVRTVMPLMLAACIGVLVLGRRLLPLVFGPAYEAAFPPLVALLPGLLAFSATTVVSPFVAARGYPVALVAVWVSGLALAVLAALLLTPHYGAVGAAAGQSIACAAVFAGVLALAYRQAQLQESTAR